VAGRRPHRHVTCNRERDMARSYYSTVFEQPADAVWRVIRDFNNYPVWVDGAGTSHIEDGKTGESVGAIRNVLYKDMRRRQRLLALSDTERAQTYEFAGDTPLPVQNFQATIRVTPVVDGDRAFVEWWATFDCESATREERVTFFRDAFGGWLGSLRRCLDRRGT
jgi:polyketide cyclase/dehydrase/lipid transport protein